MFKSRALIIDFEQVNWSLAAFFVTIKKFFKYTSRDVEFCFKLRYFLTLNLFLINTLNDSINLLAHRRI